MEGSRAGWWGWGWFRAAVGSALPWEPFPGAGQQAVGLLCLLAAPHKPWDAVMPWDAELLSRTSLGGREGA